MPDKFVPFLPNRGAAEKDGHDLNARVSGAVFQPSVTVAPGCHPVSAPVRSEPPATATISVEKEGDTITLIRVQCPCGQVTEIKCAY